MWREITPDELENVNFSTSFRGYATDEVDGFLQSAADGMRAAMREVTEKAYQRLGEDIGSLLQHARDVADEMQKKAEEQANALRADAEREASRVRQEADSAASQTRADAERDASQRTARADAEVERLGAIEAQTRERVSALRLQLTSVVDQLESLGGAETTELTLDAETHEIAR